MSYYWGWNGLVILIFGFMRSGTISLSLPDIVILAI